MKSLIISALVFIFSSIGVLSVHPHDAGTPLPKKEKQLPWSEHLETFQDRLKTDPAAARSVLQNIAETVFARHVLTEEWVPLYLRVSQETSHSKHISDLKRVFELELRMMTAIDTQTYAEQIHHHQEALAYYTEISEKLPTPSVTLGELAKKKNDPYEHKHLKAGTGDLYAIAEQHLTNFRKLLPTNPQGAVEQLDTYTTLMFDTHALIEEWKSLYIPIVRNQGGLLPEIIRLVETEMEMLTDTDPKKHAEKIKKLTVLVKKFKGLATLLERQGELETRFVPITFHNEK